MIPAMDRPTVPEDERLQFDKMVNAALRDGCVVEHSLQARQTFDPPRHVEEAVAIMPSLLIDPVSVLIELSAGPVAVYLGPVFRQPVPPAHLIVERLVEVRIDNREVQVRTGAKPLPCLALLAARRDAEPDLGAAPEQKLVGWMPVLSVR